MKLISGLWTLCVMTITLVNANECALNTECVPIADCPYIRDRFDLIENKPYCNFDRHGTHVCCVKSANECARDTECVPIADCPYVRDRFDLIENKPYCSLDLHGTHVCCVKPKQIYTQPEDVDLRIVTGRGKVTWTGRKQENITDRRTNKLRCSKGWTYRKLRVQDSYDDSFILNLSTIFI